MSLQGGNGSTVPWDPVDAPVVQTLGLDYINARLDYQGEVLKDNDDDDNDDGLDDSEDDVIGDDTVLLLGTIAMSEVFNNVY